MKTKIETEFQVVKWNEKTWDGQEAHTVEGRKCTDTTAEYRYEGEMTGTSQVHYVMSYNEDGTGAFVGIEAFVGGVRGRSGSFVMRHEGTFDKEAVRTILQVVPHSGTGDLAGMTGAAEVEMKGHHPGYRFVLETDAV